MDRKLLKLTLTSGSSRVFNCLAMTRAMNGTPSSGPTNQQMDCLFSVKALNYGVFFKEPADRSLPNSATAAIDTLLYFPYDADKLVEGGVSISLNDRRFEAVMREFSQSFGTAAHKNAANDQAILTVFKETPSLDPYLLKSAFQQHRIEVPKAYLRITDEEWLTIRNYVRRKLSPMILFGFPKQTQQREVRIEGFIDNIWDGSDVSSLFPLLEALQINAADAGEIIFAWKGLTFFEYLYQKKTTAIRSCAGWLKDYSKPCSVLRADERSRIDGRRDEIRLALRKTLQEVVAILDRYNAAYRKLFIEKSGAGEFREFLLNCPKSYLILGNALNKIDHSVEIISRTTKDDPTKSLTLEELDTLFQCLYEVTR